MTKEESKELDQVTTTEANGEAEADQDIKDAPEAPPAAAPPKKAKAEKKGSGKKEEDLKSVLGELKGKRQAALESGDKVQLKRIRGRYKKANRLLRRSKASKA
jgi:hypothetical protein